MNSVYISGKGLVRGSGTAPLLLQKGLGNTYDNIDELNTHQGRAEGGSLDNKRNLFDKLESLSLTKKPKNIKFSIKEKK